MAAMCGDARGTQAGLDAAKERAKNPPRSRPTDDQQRQVWVKKLKAELEQAHEQATSAVACEGGEGGEQVSKVKMLKAIAEQISGTVADFCCNADVSVMYVKICLGPARHELTLWQILALPRAPATDPRGARGLGVGWVGGGECARRQQRKMPRRARLREESRRRRNHRRAAAPGHLASSCSFWRRTPPGGE